MRRALATVFGIGYCPKLPGTMGSLFGLAVAWVLRADPRVQVAGCLVTAALAFWSAGPAARALGKKDPSCIVIDEVAGMMLGVAALPATWPLYLAGFGLFRWLDITKPSLIRKAEQLPGSLGIVLDDLLAGLAVQLLLRAALFLV